MGGSRSISERLSRNPSGHQPLPADYVAANQRARIINAITELVAERGYQKTTIDLIAKTAGVSLGTLYEHYANKEEGFLAAFDSHAEAMRQAFEENLDSAQPWDQLVAQALEIFLELVLAEPAKAKLCLVASQSAGSAAFARYQETLERVAPTLRRGRELNPASSSLPDGLEVAIAGGIAWLVHQRLVNDESENLRGLLPEMIQLTLTPYVGEVKARRTAHTAGSGRAGRIASIPADRVAEM
jgi:AcrR family transcriptional regulator